MVKTLAISLRFSCGAEFPGCTAGGSFLSITSQVKCGSEKPSLHQRRKDAESMIYNLCTSGCFQLEHTIGKLLVDLNIGIVGEAVVAAALPQLLPQGQAGLSIDP